MYPTLNALRGLEWRTLKTISEMGEFVGFYDLYNMAKGYRTLFREDRGNVDIHVNLLLEIRLRADKTKTLKKRRVDIGVLVIASEDDRQIKRASYGLIICAKDDPKTSSIVRKVHFDYESAGSRNTAEAKPSVHMQVCGQYSHHHISAGYRQSVLKQWFPSFEKPRIPSMPMSLAVLLNWLMLEFQTDRTAIAILKHPRWRALVAEAERTTLLPYYKAATEFLASAGKKGLPFTEHHLYEIPD